MAWYTFRQAIIDTILKAIATFGMVLDLECTHRLELHNMNVAARLLVMTHFALDHEQSFLSHQHV